MRVFIKLRANTLKKWSMKQSSSSSRHDMTWKSNRTEHYLFYFLVYLTTLFQYLRLYSVETGLSSKNRLLWTGSFPSSKATPTDVAQFYKRSCRHSFPRCCCDGVKLCPCGTGPVTGPQSIPQMTHQWARSSVGMILTWENQRARRKTCPGVTLFTINPTWTDLGANPGLRSENLTTNRLSYRTYFHSFILQISLMGSIPGIAGSNTARCVRIFSVLYCKEEAL
jgi:hypothetical protein